MRILWCCVAVLFLFGCAHMRETNTSEDVNAIIALELQLTDLLERGAIDENERHLAPDYGLTTSDGELLNRDQALAFWRDRGPGLKLTPSQMQVRVYNASALLTARVVGPDGGSGDRITKTFVRIKGSWFLAALHSSHIESNH